MGIGTETYRVRTDGAVIQLLTGTTLVQSVTATPGVVRLLYDGTKVRVLNDGNEIISTPAAAGQRLFPKITPYSTGVRIFDIRSGQAGLQPKIGSTLITESGGLTSDTGLLNSNLTIGSNGALAGGGGGQVTIGGLGFTGALNATFGARIGSSIYADDGTTLLGNTDLRNDQLALEQYQSGSSLAVRLRRGTTQYGDAVLAADYGATVGANWLSNLLGRPTNLAALAGSEGIQNSGVTVGSNGALLGAGGGQVTIGGLGFTGALNATFGARIGSSTYAADGITILGETDLRNDQLAVESYNSGGATRLRLRRGAATYYSDVDVGVSYGATVGATWGGNLSGRPTNLSGLVGTEGILNSGVTVGANGALSGAGGGQVTIGGLTPNGLDNIADGTSFLRLPVVMKTKVDGIENNADVTSIINPSPLSLNLSANSDGAIKAENFPKAIGASLVRNGVTVTSGIVWSWSVLAGTINGVAAVSAYQANSSVGVFSLDMTSFAGAEGKIRLRAVYQGTTRTVDVPIEVTRDAVPVGTSGGGGGTAATTSSISTFTVTGAASNTYGSSDNAMPNVRTGANGTITFSGFLDYYLAGVALGSATMSCVYQFSAVGGSFADVALEKTGSQSVRDTVTDPEGMTFDFTSPGSIDTAMTKTGLLANTDYQIRLRLRDDSTTRSLGQISGNATATGS